MRMAFKIFKRDLLKIKRNYAALIIVIGLCCIPSLYAWINIEACWDPYSNTGNLPVAVINKDEGAVVNSTEINVGDEIVNSLQKNKSIKWEFMDEWQANNALNEGSYYAILEIPENFSTGLVSLTTSNPKKPNITYKVNEKTNAIATKITDVAKNKLANEIKLNFVKTVNEKVFDELNKIGLHLKDNKQKILGIKDVISTTSENLGSAETYVNSSAKNADDLSKYIASVKNNLPIIKDQIINLQKAAEASKTLVTNTSNNLNTVNGDINTDIMQLQLLSQKIDNVLQDVKIHSTSKDVISKDIDQAKDYINQMEALVDSSIKGLEFINSAINNDNLKAIINSLYNTKATLEQEKATLNDLQNQVNNNQFDNKFNDSIDSLIGVNDQLNNSIVAISSSFYKNETTTINNIESTTNTNLDELNSILEITKVMVPQLDALADYGIASCDQAVKDDTELSSKLDTLQKETEQLNDKLKDLNENTLDQIIDIIQKNPSEIADFITSPIEVKQVDVYGAGVFGVGLTPFYTVLAIWVGSLLAAALLTTACEDFEVGPQPKMSERHFGKMLLFLSITIIQALIVTTGDWLILGVPVYNLPLLYGLALLTAITFTTIIFTLVSLLGNVGKAIAVIIMVFQIAGAGGIYPIQTNPKIFGILYPLWPFTYAINGFREAIAGPVWKTVGISVLALIVFSTIFIILSIFKKPLYKLNHFMEHMFEKSEL